MLQSVTCAFLGCLLTASATGQSGCQVTSAPSASPSVTGVVLANTVPRSVTGLVFQDMNTDGKRDADKERGLTDWTVYLDANGDDELTPGERTARTNADGVYVFGDLDPGTYRVRQVVAAGWYQTMPQPDDVTVTATGPAQAVSFGNLQVRFRPGG